MEGTPQKQDKGLDAGIVFGRDSHFAFVYKKTEKLVTAVYMVTNLIKDNEPLKWKIREAALSLMETNLDLNAVSAAERKDLLNEYRVLALEIVSFSSVAHHSGLISEMNFGVLAREFNSLVATLDKDEKGRDTIMLDPGFFAVESADIPRIENKPVVAPAVSKGHVSRTSSVPLQTVAPSKPIDSKDTRRATIIKLLSKKSGLNVKDFSESIKGVSEKTIQRELIAMVAAGVLKKEGERRWSTYSLASHP